VCSPEFKPPYCREREREREFLEWENLFAIHLKMTNIHKSKIYEKLNNSMVENKPIKK
jgi:hypothetical protein